MAALAGTAILIAKTAPRLAAVPRSLRWVHFGFMVVFSLIGAAGPRFVLAFCLRHERFVELFSQLNVLGVGSTSMQCLAFVFGVAGTVFYVSVMMLGNFRWRALTVFSY